MADSPELAPAEKDIYKIVAATRWLLEKARGLIDDVEALDGVVKSVNVQFFDVGDTYVPSAGLLYAIAKGRGGGGGGGGCAGTAGQFFTGGGGGGGAYSERLLTAADIGASQAVTIGAGANGGASGANNGSGGGDTSLGSLLVAKGGSGGTYGAVTQFGQAGAGGPGSLGTGDLKESGHPGGAGAYYLSNDMYFGASFGGGPGGGVALSSSNAANGTNASQYGGGGSGGLVGPGGGNASGGNGFKGYVLVIEFCST